MPLGDSGKQPILFGLLRGAAGGTTLGRRGGGVGPLRPWLKAWLPQITDTQYEALARRDDRGIQPVLLFPLGGAGLQRGTRRIAFDRKLPVVGPARPTTISGITRDGTGTVLAACTVSLYRTDNDRLVDRVVSGGDGSYSFTVGLSTVYYVIAYKAGAPDVSGTTVNTLVGVDA